MPAGAIQAAEAPLAKLQAYQASKGWTLPWYSSSGGDFNYDFQVTPDEARGQVCYNHRSEPGLRPAGVPGGGPGHSGLVSVSFMPG